MLDEQELQAQGGVVGGRGFGDVGGGSGVGVEDAPGIFRVVPLEEEMYIP